MRWERAAVSRGPGGWLGVWLHARCVCRSLLWVIIFRFNNRLFQVSSTIQKRTNAGAHGDKDHVCLVNIWLFRLILWSQTACKTHVWSMAESDSETHVMNWTQQDHANWLHWRIGSTSTRHRYKLIASPIDWKIDSETLHHHHLWNAFQAADDSKKENATT